MTVYFGIPPVDGSKPASWLPGLGPHPPIGAAATLACCRIPQVKWREMARQRTRRRTWEQLSANQRKVRHAHL